MKNSSLSLIATLALSLLLPHTATADTGSSAEILERIKSSSASSPAARWPRENTNNKDLLALPLEQRLNQLVLDDNLRTLHMLVHSDFARNTPSFKRIEGFVTQLANRDLPSKTRWEAAKALGEERHVVAVYGLPSLIQAFHGDPDITVRNYAALAMVKVDLKTAVPQLIHGLDSPDADIRQLSASAFHSAGASAVPYLVKLVKCDDPHLKSLGCLALAEVGAPATNALSALRGASTELDAKGAFSQVAEASIDRIRSENRSIQASLSEMPFDAGMWSREDHQLYRPAMAKYILSSGFLLGKDATEVTNLLGHGLKANAGKQLRYDIGVVPADFLSHEKKRRSSASGAKVESTDAWLVIELQKGLVCDCKVKIFDSADWSVASSAPIIGFATGAP